ncbi:MAG TPA: cyclic pyranopterin monophosphate synthase MoaC [Halanaerobiales bacterium]|nr:cyclic pyranopterin monophosphate synthase MoaC [Halanaerobiales bacterium]
MSGFSHIDKDGNPQMVDVTNKTKTNRKATAKGIINMNEKTLNLIKNNDIKKGPVLDTAKIAAIMAVKNTANTIPMCHPISIGGIKVDFEYKTINSIEITVTVKTYDKTGVEMEALNGVSTAALTIYDMCKAVEKNMVIGDIRLIEKSGGKSGHYIRKEGER